MTTIVTTDVTNGTVADGNVMNSNFTAVKNAVNGNLDNANINATAAIVVTKLAPSVTNGAFLQTVGGGPVWTTTFTTYVPTWSTTGTAPSLGNGTVAGRYMQIGKFVHFFIALSAGSTTTFGTGQFTFTTPFTLTGNNTQGYGIANDGGTFYPLFVRTLTTTTVGLYNVASPLTTHTGTVPFSWANGDTLEIQVFSEIA